MSDHEHLRADDLRADHQHLQLLVASWGMVADFCFGDLLLFVPDRYADDPLYRVAMAEVLGVDATLGPAAALASAASRRPICLAPGTDPRLAPPGSARPVRLVQVLGAEGAWPSEPVSVREIANALDSHPGALAREVAGLYLLAARQNQSLCSSLLTPLGPRQRDACGR